MRAVRVISAQGRGSENRAQNANVNVFYHNCSLRRTNILLCQYPVFWHGHHGLNRARVQAKSPAEKKASAAFLKHVEFRFAVGQNLQL